MNDVMVPQFTEADKDRIESAPDAIGRFLLAWRVVFEKVGECFDTTTIIESTKYHMCRRDWLWVAETIMAAESDPVTKVEWNLTWMNRGPSGNGWRPEKVQVLT